MSDQAQTSSYKPKIAEATKIACLRNFVQEFGSTTLYIIADHISEMTYETLLSIVPKNRIIRVSYGSGGISFLHAAIMIKDANIADDTMVYFVEDDYIHTKDSLKKMLEGLHIGGVDYVTGYDHPDKYMPMLQPTIDSQLYLTASCHWRTTPSTTMTFATRAGVVREDYMIYEEYCKTGYPYDDEMFRALKRKGRTLVSAIGGFSTHAEEAWLSPHTDWREVIKKYTDA
jgi:hypothetical protein